MFIHIIIMLNLSKNYDLPSKVFDNFHSTYMFSLSQLMCQIIKFFSSETISCSKFQSLKLF